MEGNTCLTYMRGPSFFHSAACHDDQFMPVATHVEHSVSLNTSIRSPQCPIQHVLCLGNRQHHIPMAAPAAHPT
jgi:hypothetical protein